MNGFQRRSNKKKQSIIESAQRLFKRHGWKRTTIAMIAKSADVSQVTIYNHFSSKENVLYEVLKSVFEAHMRTLEGIVYDANRTYDNKIDALLVLEMEHVDVLGFDVLRVLNTTDNAKINTLKKWYEANRYMIAFDHLIREGKKERAIDPTISDESFMVYAQWIRRISADVSVRNKSMVKDLLKLFFEGMRGES